MTKLIATSFLLFLFINVDAQLALDKNKLLVQKTIDSLYHAAFHSAAKWVTMKDTLVFFPTGQTHPDTSEQSSPYKIGFWINQKGLCKIEMQEYLNKQAFENGLASILNQKKYNWKRINENQFISSYDQFLLLELPPESPEFKLKIFRTSWSKELYQLLTSTKN
jgi:hypothetical protein